MYITQYIENDLFHHVVKKLLTLHLVFHTKSLKTNVYFILMKHLSHSD